MQTGLFGVFWGLSNGFPWNSDVLLGCVTEYRSVDFADSGDMDDQVVFLFALIVISEVVRKIALFIAV